MNYLQSKEILKKIKSAQKILLNIHRKPDPDTVGSTLAMKYFLDKLCKQTTIICPDKIDEHFLYLKDVNKIRTVNFASFDFSNYDLFIILDSSNWEMVTNNPNFQSPEIETLVIDHHKTNNIKGEIALIDDRSSATGEIIYKLLKDWNNDVDKKTADALFCAIAGDTVMFKHSRNPSSTYSIVSQLISQGADSNLYTENILGNYDLDFVKLIGCFLSHMEVDLESKLVWTAVTYKEYERYGKSKDAKDFVANNFLQSFKNVEFGAAILEYEEGRASVSLRSKGKIDVSKIALKFGGGGHKEAAGCSFDIHGESFDLEIRDFTEELKRLTKQDK